MSEVSAHVSGPVQAAAEGLGAEAYAMGDAVAFKSPPTVQLAAHEAAHIVQQRAGVSAKTTTGHGSERHEQEADAVASRVVQGQSAEDLLSHYGSGAPSPGAIQLQSIELEVCTNVETLGTVQEHPTLDTILSALLENGYLTEDQVSLVTVVESDDEVRGDWWLRVAGAGDLWINTYPNAEGSWEMRLQPGCTGHDESEESAPGDQRESGDSIAEGAGTESTPDPLVGTEFEFIPEIDPIDLEIVMRDHFLPAFLEGVEAAEELAWDAYFAVTGLATDFNAALFGVTVGLAEGAVDVTGDAIVVLWQSWNAFVDFFRDWKGSLHDGWTSLPDDPSTLAETFILAPMADVRDTTAGVLAAIDDGDYREAAREGFPLFAAIAAFFRSFRGARSRRTRGEDGDGSSASVASSGLCQIDRIVDDPGHLWGMSADDIAAAFNEAGFTASVRPARSSSSGRALVVEIERHPQIMQILVHPGAGVHVGPYVKISTSTHGTIRVVDETFVAPPDMRGTIVRIDE